MKSKVIRLKEDAIDILLEYHENPSIAIRDMHEDIQMYKRILKENGVK